ncbi:MAG: FHIPEP family type III secretion protein, partial [Acetobacteraceae bacterium]|nr:FHIPEP family type III secretion protein [Acetobacteraceae bacterium]
PGAAPEAPPAPEAAAPPGEEPQAAEALRIDALRVELGYGLLSLATGDAPRLTEQIKALRRSLAAEMGFLLPAVRVQDNMSLPKDGYAIRVKEVEAGRGTLRPPMHLAIDPSGGAPDLPGERCNEPAFGLPATWIEEDRKAEALARGCTVVDAAGVLATHMTEVVRDNLSELLSHAETRRLLDALPDEHRRLVSDLIPAQANLGLVQRVLQALLAERVSIRDLPTILEGIQDALNAGARAMPALLGAVRQRLARQITESVLSPEGYVPLIALGAEWEAAFQESLVGPAEERQLAMAPSRLSEFVARLREELDTAGARGEAPALVCSGTIRPHLRAVVERLRPTTPVLAQGELHPRARIRVLSQV